MFKSADVNLFFTMWAQQLGYEGSLHTFRPLEELDWEGLRDNIQDLLEQALQDSVDWKEKFEELEGEKSHLESECDRLESEVEDWEYRYEDLSNDNEELQDLVQQQIDRITELTEGLIE